MNSPSVRFVALGIVLILGACEERLEQQPVDAAGDRPADRPSDQPHDQAIDQAIDQAKDQAIDQPGDLPSETRPPDVRDMITTEMSEAGGDLPAEAPASACDQCAVDELCVLLHDGPCGSIKVCKKKTAACPAPVCNEACNREMCGAGTDAGHRTCNAAPCPETALFPRAVHCYGP